MNVSSIGQAYLSPLTSLGSVTATASATTGVDGDGDHDRSHSGGTRSVSPLAQILSELQQLQQADPGKLKTVLSDIAKQLQTTAQQDGGDQGQFLSNLASKFQQAAQTGDLSSLQPTRGHHHHHHHGAGAYQQASGQNPLTQASGVGQATPPTADPRTQVLDIISSVIGQDLGGAGVTGS